MILLALSAVLSFVLFRLHLPAAPLLGPLIAGITLSLRGATIRLPRPFFISAQAIIGCMIARALTPSIFGVLAANWALVLIILLSTLAISALTGWLLVRYSSLPGATGAWGSSPGGASAMVVMAQEYGADVRLVALMQYLRVLFVVGAAVMVVRFALGGEAQEMTQQIVWFPPLTFNLPLTLLLTAVAGWLGYVYASLPGQCCYRCWPVRWRRVKACYCWSYRNGYWCWRIPRLAGRLACSLIARFLCWR